MCKARSYTLKTRVIESNDSERAGRCGDMPSHLDAVTSWLGAQSMCPTLKSKPNEWDPKELQESAGPECRHTIAPIVPVTTVRL